MDEVVLQEPGRLELRNVSEPRAGEGEALVRVHRMGVCGTDLHAFAGRMPFVEYPRVLGHELGVEVLEVPADERSIEVGDHCAVEPYLSCGRCNACRIGRSNCCQELRVLGVHADGGMRRLLTLPVRCLYSSQKLSLDQLALVETLGIGAQAVARSGLGAGEAALIVGVGPIGLATLQFALDTGARVTVTDVNETRCTFVASTFGVEVMSGPGPLEFDVVYDATGSRAAMESSFDHVAFGGRLVFVGFVQDRIAFDDVRFHRRELTLLASRNSREQFPRIIDMIESGRIDTTPWITHRMSIREVPRRFAELPRARKLIKAMIEIGD